MEPLSFIIESSIVLGTAYGLYFLLLRKSGAFVFTRFFLLFALLVAVLVPFVEWEAGIGYQSWSNQLVSTRAGAAGDWIERSSMDGESFSSETGTVLSLSLLLWLLYAVGFILMVIRYMLNLGRLIQMATGGGVRKEHFGRVILFEGEGLPFSFFQTVFISQALYSRKGDREQLLRHEAVHCRQYHSLDILFAELLKVLLWFNPFIWLTAKAIRLNHEYLADARVLETQDLSAYQLLLVKLELANPPAILASNFSFTKKRIAMMNLQNTGKGMVFRILLISPLFFLMLVLLTFCETEEAAEPAAFENMEFPANDWWKPILEKHEITPRAYNNFEYIFEMGSTNSIDADNVVSLKDAFFVIRKGSDHYAFLRSPLAKHDLNTGIIYGDEGILETYNYKSKSLEPESVMKMINFRYLMKGDKHDIKANYLRLEEQEMEVVEGWAFEYEARDSIEFAFLSKP